MKQLPEAEVYEEGLLYWPYRASLQMVLNLIIKRAPWKATLLDVMCGPGYLLGQIAKGRPDLILTGADIDERYVSHGNATYPNVLFERHDVLNWFPGPRFDVVTCTGAVHHIPYKQQELALASIASMVEPKGTVIISDCYVDDYANEMERKLAAAKLGYEYLVETIRNGAPDNVVGWTADILWNDVLMHEFKPSLGERLSMLERVFNKVITLKPWPSTEIGGHGDYVHICSVV